jgi:hypothetical protein
MQLNVLINDNLIKEAQQIRPNYNTEELLETALRSWLDLQYQLLEKNIELNKEKPVSCYDLAKHLIGSTDAPADLSTNKAYFEGFGE